MLLGKLSPSAPLYISRSLSLQCLAMTMRCYYHKSWDPEMCFFHAGTCVNCYHHPTTDPNPNPAIGALVWMCVRCSCVHCMCLGGCSSEDVQHSYAKRPIYTRFSFFFEFFHSYVSLPADNIASCNMDVESLSCVNHCWMVCFPMA